jgi:hypothetical protein
MPKILVETPDDDWWRDYWVEFEKRCESEHRITLIQERDRNSTRRWLGHGYFAAGLFGPMQSGSQIL